MSDAPPAERAIAALPAAAGRSATPVVRTGVDVVAVSRIAALREEFGASFLGRAFTPAERRYCEARAAPAQHYAARWAATEAFRKLLAPDVDVPPLSAVGVERGADGTPALELDGAASRALEETCAAVGVAPDSTARATSLSHDRTADRAVAQVVLVGLPDGPAADGPAGSEDRA